MANDAKTFTIEEATIIFRNFAGKEGQYNREGDRNFAVILPEELAKSLNKDGWNVRALAPQDEGDSETPYITVAVSFKNRPPRVVMITSNGEQHLSEREVDVLDYAEIKSVDLIARAYEWTVNGKSGIKAYLKTMYVTIEEDELERKYSKVSS